MTAAEQLSHHADLLEKRARNLRIFASLDPHQMATPFLYHYYLELSLAGLEGLRSNIVKLLLERDDLRPADRAAILRSLGARDTQRHALRFESTNEHLNRLNYYCDTLLKPHG